MALGQEQSNSAVGEDTLLHGETLLVVTAIDSQLIALQILIK